MLLRLLQKCSWYYILHSVNWNQACLWFTLFKQWTLQIRCRGWALWGEEREPAGKKKTVAENVFCLCKDHIPYNQENSHWKGICAYPKTQPYFFISYARHYISCDLFIIFIIKATRAALTAEESKIERLKAQLKELLRFSQDVQPHAESVVSAIHQYQRYWEVWLLWWAGRGNLLSGIVRSLGKKRYAIQL